MSGRLGMTLMEIMVVILIVGVCVALAFPNFTTPTEAAYASKAQNNLLAIYSAEQNFNNNNGGNGTYCISTTAPNPCDTLAHINTAFTLNIQDDGTYGYICGTSVVVPTCAAGATCCQATRNNASSKPVIIVTLNAPIQLTGEVNPSCTVGNSWCP